MVRRRFAWTGSDWRPSAGTLGSDCTVAHRRRCQRTGVTRATPCVERRALVNTTTNRGRLAERFEEPAVYAGFAILDPEGRKIGVVRELFANGRDEPEYVRVRIGVFGLKSALIPVQLVALDEERRTITLQ
jgi:hypothetical protein